jgi:phage I-like protein
MTTLRAAPTIALMTHGEPQGEQLVHLLPAGSFRARDGRGPWQLCDAQQVIRASRAMAGRRQLPIDYEHQTEHAKQNGRPAPAAGWIKGLQARDDGIWGVVDWTASGAAHLARREYRYISPVFLHTTAGEVTCLLRAALTKDPALDQLTALARREDEDMDLAELRTLLNLADDADDVAIVDKVRELMTTARNTATPDASQYVPIGDYQRAVEEVYRLNQGIELQAATEHVEQLVRAGKVLPWMRQWAVSLCTTNKPALDAFVAKIHPGLARLLAPSGLGAAPPKSAGQAQGLSGDEIAIASRMGLSAEEFAKTAHRGAQEN